MNRFYTSRFESSDQGEQGSRLITTIDDAQDVKHLVKVLRLGPGDQVEICDGKGKEYLGTIERAEQNQVVLSLEALTQVQRELPAEITLFQGIPKGQKWEYLVQKSVEAGIHHIVPVAMVRSVSKVSEEKSDKKTDRWQKIADEAAKQAKRGVLPVFHSPLSFKEALGQQKDYDLVLIAYENESQTLLKDLAHQVLAAKRIAIWIGPEGGIDEKEVDALSALGTTITLGKRILRTETAPVVLLAQISYILE